MPQQQTIRVRGLRETLRALDVANKEVAKGLRSELKAAGQIVAVDAAQRFSAVDARSAAGFRPRVRAGGLVVVEQTRRRVTGKRPDYGALQMRRALLPALDAKSGEVEDRLERVLDNVADRFGRRP